jgi:hypothetical protein
MEPSVERLASVIDARLGVSERARAENARLRDELERVSTQTELHALVSRQVELLEERERCLARSSELFELNMEASLKSAFPEAHAGIACIGRDHAYGDRGDCRLDFALPAELVADAEARVNLEMKTGAEGPKEWLERTERGRQRRGAHVAVAVRSNHGRLESESKHGSAYTVLCGQDQWMPALLVVALRASPFNATCVDPDELCRLFSAFRGVIEGVFLPFMQDRVPNQTTYKDVSANACKTLLSVKKGVESLNKYDDAALRRASEALTKFIHEHVKPRHWPRDEHGKGKRKLPFPDR